MKATTGVSDLSLYKQRRRWNAEPGADGAGGRKTGRGFYNYDAGEKPPAR